MNYSKKIRLILFSLLFLSCFTENNTINIKGNALGTTYNILLDTSEEKLSLSKSIDSIFDVINNSMSTYIESSIISEVNENIKTPVDEHFINVFNKSKDVWEKSDKYFDPTVGTLVNAYGFGPKIILENIDNKALDSLKSLVGWEKVLLNDNNEIVKESKDIFIDFNKLLARA